MDEIHELSRAECLGLLGTGSVGRVALSTPLGPYVVPVGYGLVDDGVVFRTSPHSVLGTQAEGAMVAFEIDRVDDVCGPFDHDRHGSWSVIVRGRASAISSAGDLERLGPIWGPPVWPSGRRNLHLRVPIVEVTGRRFDRPCDVARAPGAGASFTGRRTDDVGT